MNPQTTDIAVRPGGDVGTVRQEFGATEVTAGRETAASAIAAREQAQVQARYLMALRQPRNVEQFRRRLIDTCKRPSFAAKAEYAKPIGKEKDPDTGEWVEKKAKGPSIRFVEAALREFGNIGPEVSTVFDSQSLRICRVTVTDFETNTVFATEVQIQKTVERKGKQDKRTKEWAPPEGREILGERTNSYGEPVWTVLATDDEVLVKQNALLSKAIRTLGLRLLPYDVIEDAMKQAKYSINAEWEKDPATARRRVIDAFAEVGVQPIDLEAWLGHSLDKPLQTKEREELLAIHAAIKEGETTWKEVMESKDDTGSEELAADVKARKLAEAEAFKNGQQNGDAPQGEQAPAGDTKPRTTAPLNFGGKGK